MLKPFLFISAVAVVLSAPTAASAQAAGAKSAGGETEKAKKIYSMDCALCHGATGDGKTDLAKDMQLTMSDWTDPKSLSDKKDDDLFKMIRKGDDKMPPEDTGRAKDDEVKALIVYIRTFSKNAPPPTAAPAAAPAATPAASAASGPPAPSK